MAHTMSDERAIPFIGVRMHENRTPTGRRTSTPARHTALYFAYGRGRQAQMEEKQRGQWLGPDGRPHTHEAVMAWVKEAALTNRYTFEALLSVQQGALTPAQFCQAMSQSGEIGDWRLVMHQDTRHRHAHVLFFRDSRLDKSSFLAWQTAVRQELARLEQQQLAAAPTTSLENEKAGLRMAAERAPALVPAAEPKRSQRQEVALGW
jgi:hypothetical protein